VIVATWCLAPVGDNKRIGRPVSHIVRPTGEKTYCGIVVDPAVTRFAEPPTDAPCANCRRISGDWRAYRARKSHE
jgi:hypothetical protein